MAYAEYAGLQQVLQLFKQRHHLSCRFSSPKRSEFGRHLEFKASQRIQLARCYDPVRTSLYFILWVLSPRANWLSDS